MHLFTSLYLYYLGARCSHLMRKHLESGCFKCGLSGIERTGLLGGSSQAVVICFSYMGLAARESGTLEHASQVVCYQFQLYG